MDKKKLIENLLDNRSFQIPAEDLDIARHEIGLMLDTLITSAVEEERERIMKSINPQYKPKP